MKRTMAVAVLLLVVAAASGPAPDEPFNEVFGSLGESLDQMAVRHRTELDSGINKRAARSIFVERGPRPADFNLSVIESSRDAHASVGHPIAYWP
jgi:hypothetical protein